ncbi:MAG TPA: cation diffusion facilitator family transporter [Thermodesulforhabdus norvegica]|uniref:Cation diffusion facilitator family transporter n=1 Tax=Thermodesulforhabdus norvegica TaxID=39841 RepID=A0A7C1B172_9BACT|nr:cation diffusion facilitator family transporter [Thermodesulforhabdus norvegica]
MTVKPKETHNHYLHHHTQLEATTLSDDKRTIFAVIIINLVIPVVQVIGGLFANSMAIISDAVHNFSDFTSLIIAYIALTLASKKATPTYTFGFRRAEVIAAFANVFLLLGVCTVIVKEAIRHFLSGGAVVAPTVIALAVVGIVGNGLCAWLLHRRSQSSLNIRSAFLHMLADFLTSIAVCLEGIVLLFRPWYWLDVVLSFAIVGFILKNCWGIVSDAIHILMNAAPKHIDLTKVKRILEKLPGVEDVHDLHAWSISSSSTGFSCHIVVPDCPLSELEKLKDKIQEILFDRFQVDHPVIQFETTGCGKCSLICSDVCENGKHIKEIDLGNSSMEPQTPTQKWLKRYALVTVRLLFGSIFIYASISKILHPKEFALVVYNYGLLPDKLVNLVAIVLPWIECLCGLAIALGILHRGALLVVNALLVIFTGAILANIARGMDITCGCFEAELSQASRLSMWLDVLRDIMLLIVGIMLFMVYYARNRKK